ncbi:MAG: hypothetical protein RR162_00350 [Oscillospiraceae bacterium]
MTNFDDMKLAVQALSGGTNTVILDDLGMPSIMVVIPQYLASDLIAGATQSVHPAFTVNGVNKPSVAISKYLNIVANNRAYSLPMQDPANIIDFDRSLQVCRNKGDGWGLTPMSLWSAIALWCKKNGTQPHGNNSNGKDVAHPHEKGVATYSSGGTTCRTATGSGPATWNHNWLPDGISDLNGNVWEWQAGMRLVAGEIQIIPYANCMSATCDMGATSTEWKAIKADGTFVAPGTAGTLKLDYVGGKVVVCTTITTQADSGVGGSFQTMTTASGIVVPQILKELTLFPADADGYEGDYFYLNNGVGLERVPFRGGDWNFGANAGVFNSTLYYPRSFVHTSFGFRSAFYGEL